MTTCKQCSTDFEITDEDRTFYDKVSPIIGGKKYPIPEPDLCSQCRQIRRLCWRNERTLYHRQCGFCQKPVISIYSPDNPYITYCHQCWWGDEWSAMDYGKDFDFNRSFFEQFDELLKAVPKMTLLNYQVENCEYNNYNNESRNCHLTFGSGYMEDCMYMDWSYHGKDTFDCSYCTYFQLDYMNVDCTETYHCKFCQDCHNSSDCEYSFDLRGCKNCFGCVGLRNKEYHIFNKPYKKEQYAETVRKLKNSKHKENILSETTTLKSAHPHQASRILNSQNCTGDHINNSKNCSECYDITGLEDCKYMYDVFKGKDCMDHNRTGETELCYFNGGGGYYKNVLFSGTSVNLHDALYCFACMYSGYLFGSDGAKHNKYLILNKQYSKDEYEKQVSKIIEHMKETGEWGQFLSADISTFAYNETLAQEFFPTTKEECVKKGFRWKEPDKKEYQPQTYQVPEDIKEVPTSIIDEVLACKVTSKNFKITPQELKLYLQENLPIPDRCPDQRYLDRLALKNPRKLYNRKCDKCSTEIQTTYSPDRTEKVYCEECYLKEIY